MAENIVRNFLDRNVQLPSPATQGRYRLRIDVAYMHCLRENFANMPPPEEVELNPVPPAHGDTEFEEKLKRILYIKVRKMLSLRHSATGIPDTSPQGGIDWLLLVSKVVRSEHLQEYWELCKDLAEAHTQLLNLAEDGEERGIFDEAEDERFELLDRIRTKSVRQAELCKFHRYPPTALALRETSLVQKMGAYAHTVGLQHEDAWEAFDCKTGVCADAGTESGAPEFPMVEKKSLTSFFSVSDFVADASENAGVTNSSREWDLPEDLKEIWDPPAGRSR